MERRPPLASETAQHYGLSPSLPLLGASTGDDHQVGAASPINSVAQNANNGRVATTIRSPEMEAVIRRVLGGGFEPDKASNMIKPPIVPFVRQSQPQESELSDALDDESGATDNESPSVTEILEESSISIEGPAEQPSFGQLLQLLQSEKARWLTSGATIAGLFAWGWLELSRRRREQDDMLLFD